LRRLTELDDKEVLVHNKMKKLDLLRDVDDNVVEILQSSSKTLYCVEEEIS